MKCFGKISIINSILLNNWLAWNLIKVFPNTIYICMDNMRGKDLKGYEKDKKFQHFYYKSRYGLVFTALALPFHSVSHDPKTLRQHWDVVLLRSMKKIVTHGRGQVSVTKCLESCPPGNFLRYLSSILKWSFTSFSLTQSHILYILFTSTTEKKHLILTNKQSLHLAVLVDYVF